MGWNASIPTTAEAPCGSTENMRSNWSAIESWFNSGHYTFTSAGSGEHKAGVAGILYKGTSTQVAALSSPGTGAMAIDTTKGRIQDYSGSEWRDLTHLYASKVSVDALFPSSSFPSTGTNYPLSGSSSTTVNVDILSEFNETTTEFTTKYTGYYYVCAKICHLMGLSYIFSHYGLRIMIYVNGALASVGTSMPLLEGGSSVVADILYLTTGDVVSFKIYHMFTYTSTSVPFSCDIWRLS